MAVLGDVQVGDVVEVAYTIDGDNPIFEGRIGHVLDLASDGPVDHLHLRATAPRDRTLYTKPLATTIEPERFDEGGEQVIRVVRRNVPAVVPEANTPPWFKVYPAIQISEYRDWSEVDAWAQRLFAPAKVAGPLVRAKVAELKASGLEGEALVAQALRFVQDEVRYFSASLGVNSHRPKSAEQTLAERLGDCKDKTTLLVTMLEALGFDAKPALVSTARNRGLANYHAGHEQFDHVITRAVVGGTTYWLDATVTGQGLELATRGQFPFGRALVVGGSGGDLETVPQPSAHASRIDYVQRWDFSRLDAPATLQATMTVAGAAAERWRATAASATPQQIADALAGAHARARPGLGLIGEPRIDDDRKANVLSIGVSFDYAAAAAYRMGGLDIDFTAFELTDYLQSPGETTRRTPWLLDMPRLVTSTIEVVAPQPFGSSVPAPVDVQDRHFAFSVKAQASGNRYSYTRKLERRGDEVLPANLAAYREHVQRVRGLVGHAQRVLLINAKDLAPVLAAVERRLAAEGVDDDELGKTRSSLVIRRAVDTLVLERLGPKGGALAGRIEASLAEAAVGLGDFTAALAHADRALAVDAADDVAREQRGLALVGLGRLDDAYEHLQRIRRGEQRVAALAAMADLDRHRGRHAQAEALLREVIDAVDGPMRSRALLELFVAAEAQGAGRGKAAVAGHLDQADVGELHGALLHHMAGGVAHEDVLRLAHADKSRARSALAEAYYYLGALHAARGRAADALEWYERCANTRALSTREVRLARLELARAGRDTVAMK
jgi:transglutaminase-like putative cysteine protease